MNNFVHLHNHTTGSLLDGFSSAEQYVERLIDVGQTSMAITDHGNMFGTLDFYRAMRKNKLHPVIGMEAYIVQWGNTMSERGNANREANHMLLLAQNQTGYNNLIKLSSIGFLEGFYYKPKIDWNALSKHSDGIIATSGCMAAPINRAIQEGNIELAEEMICWHLNVFADRFYMELQIHPGIPELNPVNKILIELGKKYNVKAIVTNDSHYAKPENADPHGVMLCIQTRKTIDDPKRFKFTDNDYYLKTADEMRELLQPMLDDDSIDEMFAETIRIAESTSCDLEGDMKPKIPHIELPVINMSENEYLEMLSFQGLAEIYGQEWQNIPAVLKRYNEEIEVIKSTGFAAYYLIIYDICKFAQSQNISWNTRGSAAGSLIFYAIGVSFVDPIENKLLFSRFIGTTCVLTKDDLGIF